MNQQKSAPSRLVRRTDDKVIAGVCSGIAHYFGIDPVVVRVIVVVMTIFGGSGLLAYGVAWLMLPANDGTKAIIDVGGDDSRRITVVVLAAVVLILVFTGGWGDPGRNGDHLLPIALIGGGAYLLLRNRDQDDRDEPNESSSTPPAPPAPTAPWTSDEVRAGATLADATALQPEPAATEAESWYVDDTPRPPATPRPRSWLTSAVLGVLLLGLGTLWMLSASHTIHPAAEDVIATCLIVVGAGLVLGAWFGRGRALIALGLALTLALTLVAAIDVPLEGGAGDRLYRPVSVAQVPDAYRLAAGELVIDLTDLPRSERAIDIEATVVAGSLRVHVPADASIDVDAHVSAGQIGRPNGPSDDGLDVDQHYVDQGGSRIGQRLHLDLRVGFGEVVVVRD
jgi:phage shock protein PspC (stress-responsive transcriptional regulator)